MLKVAQLSPSIAHQGEYQKHQRGEYLFMQRPAPAWLLQCRAWAMCARARTLQRRGRITGAIPACRYFFSDPFFLHVGRHRGGFHDARHRKVRHDAVKRESSARHARVTGSMPACRLHLFCFLFLHSHWHGGGLDNREHGAGRDNAAEREAGGGQQGTPLLGVALAGAEH